MKPAEHKCVEGELYWLWGPNFHKCHRGQRAIQYLIRCDSHIDHHGHVPKDIYLYKTLLLTEEYNFWTYSIPNLSTCFRKSGSVPPPIILAQSHEAPFWPLGPNGPLLPCLHSFYRSCTSILSYIRSKWETPDLLLSPGCTCFWSCTATLFPRQWSNQANADSGVQG